MSPRALAVVVASFALACGGSSEPPAASPESAASAAPAASAAAGAPAEAAGPSASAAPAAEPSAAGGSPSATLARDIVKSGGRWIAYSSSKKGFAYPVTRRQSNGTFGLDVRFVGEDAAARDVMSVCHPGECEEKLDEIAKTFIPKLAARFDEQGYVGLRGIGWPEGRDELEVSSLGMRLKLVQGRLEGVHDGKPNVRLTQVGGKALSAATLEALFVVPGNKLVAAFAKGGEGGSSEFSVLKLP